MGSLAGSLSTQECFACPAVFGLLYADSRGVCTRARKLEWGEGTRSYPATRAGLKSPKELRLPLNSQTSASLMLESQAQLEITFEV